MDWRKILMDSLIASIITGNLGVIAVLISNGYTNKKGYEKIDSKIGYLYNTNLSRQHEDIERSIKVGAEDIEKTIEDKTLNIYTKVDNIDKITTKNEALYMNLNQDQREVRNNVSKLVHDWERIISENKELKFKNEKLLDEITSLKESRFEAGMEIKDIKSKLDELISTNKIILEENQILKNRNLKLEEKNNDLYGKLNELNHDNEDDLEM